MKRRWPFIVSIAGCLVLGLGWLVRPVGPRLPPEILGQLTADRRLPHPFLVGSPPPGTAWEMYVVPVAYARITEAMEAEPGWQMRRGEFMGAKTRAMYRSTDAGQAGAMDVMPGRFAVMDPKSLLGGPGLNGKHFSVVAIALPNGGSFRQTAIRWIDRLRGRPTSSLPKGAVLAYFPPSPQELTLAIGQGKAVKPALRNRSSRPRSSPY